MLKIRAGWIVSAALCLLVATSGFAANDYAAFDSAASLGPDDLALLGLNNAASLGAHYSAFLGNHGFIHRTQTAEITRSFNYFSGVANVNNAAGNLNNGTAFTTLALGGISPSGFLHQGYAGTFIVGNAVFGQGVLSQDIYLGNNGAVVRQRIVGFLVDAQHTEGLVAISRSFQGYTGVATVNQAAGNLNNQATMAGVNFGPGSRCPLVYSDSDIRHNEVLLDGSSYKAIIGGGSFQDYRGMLALSQTAGNLNNTVNYVGLSVNTAPTAAPEIGPALSNKQLGNITVDIDRRFKVGTNKTDNKIDGNGACPEAKIEGGAFCNFTGVASITQVAGNANQVVSQVGVNVR